MAMGQFEKWEDENCVTRDCGGATCDDCERLRWDGWKAALEWVKSRSEVAKSLYMINVNDIDDELGAN